MPGDAGLDWLRAMADPADDLRMPMKGPFHTLRDGSADLHRAGDRLGEIGASAACGSGVAGGRWGRVGCGGKPDTC